MRNRAVLASVVAIVVAACGGAAMDGVGDAMRDAGELLNNAGDAMVDAGNAIAGSIAHAAGGEGGASGETGSAGSSSSSGTGGGTAPAADALPNPRWVLRDKDAAPVQALIGDFRYSDAAARVRARFTEATGDCITIDRLGQREIGLSYSLVTGKLDGCQLGSYPGGPKIRGFYTTSTCDGTPYTTSYQDETFRIGDTWYYVDASAPVHAETYYQWNGAACVVPTIGSQFDLFPYKPLPAGVLNALPNPPYSLSVAY